MQRPYIRPIIQLQSLLALVLIGLNSAHFIRKQYRHCSANTVGQLYHSSVLPTFIQCLPHGFRSSRLLSDLSIHITPVLPASHVTTLVTVCLQALLRRSDLLHQDKTLASSQIGTSARDGTTVKLLATKRPCSPA